MLAFAVILIIILSFIAWVVWELRHAVKVDDDDADF